MSLQIDLVFPPFDYSILMPEMGIPLLTANLRRAGFEVRQADFNVEFIHVHLSRLSSFVEPLSRFDAVPERRKRTFADDPGELLDFLAAQLARLAGRTPPPPGSTAAALQREGIAVWKSCHLNESQVRPAWTEELGALVARRREPLAPSVLSLLDLVARHGSRRVNFRKDLLRIVHHYYMMPDGFAPEDVMVAAGRPNVFLDPFYAARLESMFEEREPDLFGIAIWSTSQLVPALALARRVRAMLPRVTLVAGGAWCTYARRLIPRLEGLRAVFDAFVVHEGVRALERLAGELRDGRGPARIPNVVRRSDSRGRSLRIEPPSAFEDVGMPVYDGLPVTMYPRKKLALRLFRGCYWARCSFCTHACHPLTRRYAFRKTDTLPRAYLDMVAAHVREVGDRYGIRDFTLADNLVSPAVMRQLCDLAVDRSPGITWDSMARFENAYTASFCSLLRRGGCTRLDLGLETASDEGLRRIHKGITMKTVVRNLGELQRAGIRTKVFVIHYPGQPPEEFEATLKFLVEQGDRISEIAVSRFCLAMDTIPFARPGELGLRIPAGSAGALDVFHVPYAARRELPLDEMIDITRRYLPGYW